ncbi:MAG: hypothetical protein ACRCT6_08550, partial [Notoacmeibacter sp.]
MSNAVQSKVFGGVPAPHAGLLMALFLVAACALSPLIASYLPAVLVDYPKSAIIPLSAWIGDNLNWLARKASIGSLRIADITRALASILEFPIDVLNTVLASGIKAGRGDQVHIVVPPVSWLAFIGLAGIAAHFIAGFRLAILTICGLL